MSPPFQLPLSAHPIVLLLGSCAALACGPSNEASRISDPGPIHIPFAVSDYFSPSGDMGDGEHAGYLTTDINENCLDRPDGARGDCYRFTYTLHAPGDLLWAGAFWAYPANNWGTRRGRRIDAPATGPLPQVAFYAAASPETAQIYAAAKVDLAPTFLVGGIQYPEALAGYPYKDKFKELSYPTLTTEFQRFTIPFVEDFERPKPAGCDTCPGVPAYDEVIGAFGWALAFPPGTDPTNAEPIVLYVDDIVWEWQPAPASPPADGGTD
jgi:hypothetical protein